MSKRIVVIGAVAAGTKAACRAKRLLPEAEVIMVDQSEFISYDRCGLQYYVGGDLSDLVELMVTTYKTRRDVDFFAGTKGVEARLRTLARAIDRDRQVVLLEDKASGQSYEMAYDRLVLATGATPVRLAIPGAQLPGVMTVYDPHEAEALKAKIVQGEVGRVVIIGGGMHGLGLAEAAADLWGLETAVVERAAHLLPGCLDPALALMVEAHLRDKGVEVWCGQEVIAIEAEDGQAARVVTSARTLEADLVIMAVGCNPNVELARDAGLALGVTGAIKVDGHLMTSDPNIYAGGDCVEQVHLVSGQPVFYPNGAIATRQGRILGTNVAGGQDVFEGIIGTCIMKLFDLSVASTGLTLTEAPRLGFEALGILVSQADLGHFYPGQEMVCLHLVVERPTQRVLGVQGVGPVGAGMKACIDAVAAMLKYRPTINDLGNLEVASSPPFASTPDIINTAAYVAENALAGRYRFLPAEQFLDLWRRRESEPVVFIDTREPDNAGALVARWGPKWLNIPQGELRQRLGELPLATPLVLVCNSGLRSYEAQVLLDANGQRSSLNLNGGLVALKKAGLDLLAGTGEEFSQNV